MFLSPDLKPVYGGTYFPPRGAYGRPGFTQVLQALAAQWETEKVSFIWVKFILSHTLVKLPSLHKNSPFSFIRRTPPPPPSKGETHPHHNMHCIFLGGSYRSWNRGFENNGGEAWRPVNLSWTVASDLNFPNLLRSAVPGI